MSLKVMSDLHYLEAKKVKLMLRQGASLEELMSQLARVDKTTRYYVVDGCELRFCSFDELPRLSEAKIEHKVIRGELLEVYIRAKDDTLYCFFSDEDAATAMGEAKEDEEERGSDDEDDLEIPSAIVAPSTEYRVVV